MIEPATAALSEPIAPRIGILTTKSQRRRTAGDRPWPSLPTTIASGPRRSDWRAVSGAPASAPTTLQATDPEVRQGPGQVIDGTQEEMLDRSRRRLHGRRAEWRLTVGREDHAVDAGGLGAPQQGPDVLGILERVEGEDERRLAALDAPGEDLVQGREPARTDDQGNPLVAVEPGEGREGSAFHLDDRDPEARGVQDQALECLPALGHDQEADRRPTGDEGLFDRAASCHQFLVTLEEAGGRGRRATVAVRGSAWWAPGSAGRPRPRRPGPGSRPLPRPGERRPRAARRLA